MLAIDESSLCLYLQQLHPTCLIAAFRCCSLSKLWDKSLHGGRATNFLSKSSPPLHPLFPHLCRGHTHTVSSPGVPASMCILPSCCKHKPKNKIKQKKKEGNSVSSGRRSGSVQGRGSARGLFCSTQFPQITEKSSALFIYTSSGFFFGPNGVPHHHPRLFVFKLLYFVIWGFFFSFFLFSFFFPGSTQEGNLSTFYLQNHAWESRRLSPLLPGAGSVWLGGKATAHVI